MNNKYFLRGLLCAAALCLGPTSFAQVYDWSNRIGGRGSDLVEDITVDATGNVYVAGSFADTVDFDPGPGTEIRIANRLPAKDAFVAKYDKSGGLLWVHTFTGAGDNSANAIALDADGHINIAGSFTGNVDFDPGAATEIRPASGYSDIFILQLDNAGSFNWVATVGDLYIDAAQEISVDASGNLFVGGVFAGTPDFDPGSGSDVLNAAGGGIFFTKYDKDGNYKWARNIGCNGGSQSIAGIELDASGNLYLAGSYNGPANFDPLATLMLPSIGLQDIYIASYDASGHYRWAKHMGVSLQATLTNDIKVTKSGDLTITGMFYDAIDFDPGAGVKMLSPVLSMSHNLFVARYDQNGDYSWAFNLGSATTGGGVANGCALALDEDENLFVSGLYSGKTDFDPGSAVAAYTAVAVDLFCAKYDAAGKFVWVAPLRPSSFTSGPVLNYSLVARDGAVYMGGSFLSGLRVDPFGTAAITSEGAEDGFIIKYNDELVSVTDPSGLASASLSLYPNPVSEQLTISLPDPYAALAGTLDIFDMRGIKVGAISWNAGTNSRVSLRPADYQLAAGIYQLRAAAGAYRASASFVVR